MPTATMLTNKAGEKNNITGEKNDITGEKMISRDILFLCYRVIALIRAQVCDKLITINIYQVYTREIKVFKVHMTSSPFFFQKFAVTRRFE